MIAINKMMVIGIVAWSCLMFSEVVSADIQIISAALGGPCVLEGAKVKCPAGSSCWKGACNCDNLAEGTVTSISQDAKGVLSCRRVAGQKCSSNDQCFDAVQCLQGVCTCDKSKPTSELCVSKKVDIMILA